ncbi:afadin-like isoform X3 [Mercenaria mercenaria]|uniref:afadin-like isoform X3 n=1 Tax=Mercenaria mercenaria TaxID=6596 RepID=UPI00234F1CC7|nr:afadin-like isoform X3 [Mercenaria mercenaria]
MVKPEEIRDRQKLANLISQWNSEHYDLFELSPPNESLEFHGVVRFYFQDDDHNVVTKCIRVASSATTKEVVDVLVEKFRPDMRMLTANRYNLFEVHINGEERKLLDDERILYVQLNWGKDVREGRFLLRREGATTAPEKENAPGFKRKLSKREKKEKKKADKERKMNKENVDKNGGVAQQLYTDAPETSFTRSISNPEAVMRRRRQQKLEKKLQQFHGQNGQGGTLKIYGETLKPDVPYKTLLLSTADTVKHVIKEAMEKYGVDTEDTSQFVLVEVLVPPGEREYHGGTIGEERIMEDDECPLAIAMQHPPSRDSTSDDDQGMLMFQLKRKNADMIKPKYKRQRAVSHEDLRSTQAPSSQSTPPNKLPFLVELNPDGTENLKGKVHRLHLDVTEVGREKSVSTSGQYLQLFGPNIQPRHCVIAHTSGIVTVTPTSRESETYVNNQRVHETTLLQHGMTVKFGKQNAFRFFDPSWEEKQRKGQMPQELAQKQATAPPFPNRPQETNFDMDGRVETMTDGSRPNHPQRQESRQSAHSSLQGSSMQGSIHDDVPRGSPRDSRPDGTKFEDALPASLEFRDDKENDFLSTVILDTNASATQFKLSPTYTMYLAVRFRLSSAYRPELSPSDRAHKLTSVVNKIAQMIPQAIQDNRDNPATLAFWMANASEILHFFKQDHDIHLFSQDSQEMLAEAVQMAFHHLVRCLQYDLQRTLPAFLDENDDDGEIDDRARYNRNKPTMMDILDTLSSAMNLLRRCRVNAALTIQLFSQLFHFINMWVFNILVTEKRLNLCTRAWGVRLKRRLGRVEAWAEKQGLELAADCHLCRIIQAAHLLQAPKSSPDDIANISSTCFKLNSLQLRELLERYQPEPMEPPIPHNLIDRVVSVAQNMADELIRTDGRQVQLEEDQDLQLPFLLPEDGYSCDTIKGVPNGLADFIEPLTRSGLCRMAHQPQASGLWTVYMSDDESSQIIEESIRERKDRTPDPRQQAQQQVAPQQQPQGPSSPITKEPEVIVVSFNKVKGSMGLSIVAAKGDGQRERGIYIKSVVPEGAAAIDGRLQAGDQLLEVDGKSLVGLTQEKAAELMTRTGHTVTLKVAKQGAIYHGLATLLSQPSPIMQRASPQKTPMTPSKQRPGEEGPPPYNGMPENDRRPGMQKDSRTLPRDMRGQGLRGPDSRSSPALNTDSKSRRRKSSFKRERRNTWHTGIVPEIIKTAEIRDRRAWAECTFPGARLGRKKPANYQSRVEIEKLKTLVPIKVLKQKVEQCELRDYRAKAEKLTPKGEYFGMNNFHRSLSVASYFSRGTLYSYPKKVNTPSLHELVSAEDGVSEDDVFESGFSTSRSESGLYDTPSSRQSKSDSELTRRWLLSDQPMSAAERLRVQPAGHQQPHPHGHFNRRDNRDMMDKSKSIPNLHMDNSFDGRPDQGMMRPAQSVSALQRNQNPHADYYNQPHSLEDSRSHDYENQPIDPRIRDQNRGYPNTNQPSPGMQYNRPPMHQSPARTSQNFERPQSQFIAPHERPELVNGRPKSEEISPEKLRNWQDMDRSQGSPHDSFENRVPNYSNIRPQPNYANQGEIRKMDMGNQSKQPNFYENTLPRQQEPTPPFQQLRRPEEDKSKPAPAPKPSVAPKPNQPLVHPAEIPRSEIDNRQTQPHFYNPQLRDKPGYQQASQGFNTSPNSQSHYQNTSFHDGRADFRNKHLSGGNDMHKSPNMSAPMHEIPPELPPPPSMEEMHDEELPPLPPPPVMDYRLEQKIREEQNRLLQQPPSDPSYSNLPPQNSRNQPFSTSSMMRDPRSATQPGNQSLPPHSAGYQPPMSSGYQPQHPTGYQPPHSAGFQSQQPQSLPVQSSGYQPNHDYQNINYPNRSMEHSPSSQPPQQQQQQNLYESYDPRKQQSNYRPPIHTQIKDQRESILSPWQREEKEKQQKEQEEGMNRIREMEIAELESRPHRTPQEEERLRKLRLDAEFNRRLQEVQNKDEEEDSDDDRFVSTRVSVQGLQEDLVKSRMKMQELEQKRQYEDMEKEKDRMQRLERRIEMFEREREEQRQRQQRRIEKQQRESEEYLRKQKEAREQHRREIEDNLRLQRLEEEKLREKKRQEEERRKEMERQRQKELQAQKDAEEARAREEIRRQEEEYQRQQLAEQERRRREEEREIRVAEERKRLEALANQQNQYYSQYENLPPQGSPKTVPDPRYGQSQYGPPPPERGSSYDTGRNMNARPDHMDRYNGGYHMNPPSQYGSSQENIPSKKSVSFNPQVNLEVGPGSPGHNSSYQPFQRAYTPPEPQNMSRTNYSQSQSVPVSSVPSPSVNNNDVKYRTQENTPTVIGSQEIYRDPRSRIEAKMANKNKQNVDRLSFRDKMKFFAQEAGEHTPKEKPKASTSQRRIESQLLYNGQ